MWAVLGTKLAGTGTVVLAFPDVRVVDWHAAPPVPPPRIHASSVHCWNELQISAWDNKRVCAVAGADSTWMALYRHAPFPNDVCVCLAA